MNRYLPFLGAYRYRKLSLCQQQIPVIMTLPGTRQAAAWGTGSALRSHRIRDLFGFVTPRIRKGQFSATLRTRSGLFLTPSKGMLQNAESGGTTGCECSDHVRYS